MPVGSTAFYGQNQSPRITTTYLNQQGRTGDPDPGVNVSTAQMPGYIVQPYSGFEGGKLTITNTWAPQFADPAVGPLYGGVYMYVQVDPAGGPLVRGQAVFWSNSLRYIVTAIPSQPLEGQTAGIAVNNTAKGHWDFIQVAGIAMVLFGTITGPTPGVGEVIRVPAGSSLADAGGQMTPFVPAEAKTVIGISTLVAPANNSISPVRLNLAAEF